MRPAWILALLVALPLPMSLADTLDVRVDEALAKLASGDASDLVITRYEDPAKAATAFAKRISVLASDEQRIKVVLFAAELERRALRAAGQSVRSHDLELAAAWAALTQNDSSDTVRGSAAQSLRDLFPAQVLSKYSEQIAAGAQRSRNREVLWLYGVLPSTRASDILGLVRTLRAAGDIDAVAADAVSARFGDQDAEQRLLQAASGTTAGGLVATEQLFEALAYVPTDQCKKALARGLRSEVLVDLAGGSAVPQRNFYARALVQMMRDEADFPVRAEGLQYSDAQLDQIEQWCTRHLNVTFDREPRKPLRVVPGIEPAPQGLRQ